jgi:hypothetical protein
VLLHEQWQFLTDARKGCVVSITPRPLYPKRDPVLIVQEDGWASGLAWTCAKNLFPTGIRSPDRSARSQSLYRLSYPGPKQYWYKRRFPVQLPVRVGFFGISSPYRLHRLLEYSSLITKVNRGHFSRGLSSRL